jgi:hypothetical protein
MRKEVVEHRTTAGRSQGSAEWLDLDAIAHVQLTSEDPAFDAPQHIRRIFLHFIERETERVQEFVLRYASASETDREIVRQQWTFSPTGSTQEIEDYAVELESATTLELVIDPDRGRGQSLATLNALRLA